MSDKNIKKLFEEYFNNASSQAKENIVDNFCCDTNYHNDTYHPEIEWKFEDVEVDVGGEMVSKDVVISTVIDGEKKYLKLAFSVNSDGVPHDYYYLDKANDFNPIEVFPAQIMVTKYLTEKELELKNKSVKMKI